MGKTNEIELKNWILHYQKTKDRPTMHKIIKATIGLVHSWVYKQRDKREFEDMVQEGTISLMKGVENYDPKKGASPTTWLSYWIRLGLMLYRRDTINKYEEREFIELSELQLGDKKNDSLKRTICKQELEFVDKFICALPTRMSRIFERRIIDGDTLESIGRDEGLTRERVRQIEVTLRGRFRKFRHWEDIK